MYDRYRIVEPMDGEWGRLVGSNWTGMVGQLVKHVNIGV